MELVAFLGTDKENWGQITALINRFEWEKIFLVKNKNSEEFSASKKCETIIVNSDKPLLDLKKEMNDKLSKKLGNLEGNGKEHMALISSLLSLPVGIRLVVFTKAGVEFIN